MERSLDDVLASVANRENSTAFHSAVSTQSYAHVSTKFMIICPYFSSNSRNNPLFLSSFIRYGRDRVGKKGSRRYVSRLYRCKRIVGRRNNAARKGGRGGRTETKGTARCDSSTPSRIRLSFFSPFYLSLLTSSSQPRSLAFKGAILARLISHSFLLGLLEYRIKGYLNRSSV